MAIASSILTALNAGYNDVIALITNRYNFTDEPIGNTAANNAQITDGGIDMYDNGNILNTNLSNSYANVRLGGYATRLATSLQYTHTKQSTTTFSFTGNGTVNSGTSWFGAGSSYFTNLYPGMFVMVATEMTGVTEFSVSGNIGVDGGGLLTTDDYTLSVGGTTYSIYRKSIYNTTDPSINHIFIIPGDGAGVTHSWDTSRQWDDNVIQGINVSYLYYLLIAKRNATTGTLLSNSEATSVITKFLETIGNYSSVVGDLNIGGTSTVLPTYLYTIPAGKEVLGSAATCRPILRYTATGGINLRNSSTARFVLNPYSVSDTSFGTHTLLKFEFGSVSLRNTSTIRLTIFATTSGRTALSGSAASLLILPATASDKSRFTNSAHCAYVLNPQSASDGEIVDSASIQFCLTIRPESIDSEYFHTNHTLKRYFYVSSLFLCRNGNIYSYMQDKDGAWISSSVALEKRLYRRCINPIDSRPRLGIYITDD